MGERITVTDERGAWGAYLARPPAGDGPPVVVLHEVFGVNADMRQICDDLAARGFVALCPELFWRQCPAVDLDVRSLADWNRGLEFYTAYDRDEGVKDIAATVRAARRLAGEGRRAGLLGYCLGGLMTFLVAARTSIDAAVEFHGADTDRYLDEARGISAPFMMHLAEEDEFIAPLAQTEIVLALQSRPNAIVYGYPGQRHAFSRHGGLHYNAAAATLANQRTWDFLHAHLD